MIIGSPTAILISKARTKTCKTTYYKKMNDNIKIDRKTTGSMKGIGIKFCKLFIWYPDISECVSIDYKRQILYTLRGQLCSPPVF